VMSVTAKITVMILNAIFEIFAVCIWLLTSMLVAV
jgi:hypothetical protein